MRYSQLSRKSLWRIRTGQILMSLRHGPVPPGRRMFDVSADETIALAAGHGLSAHHCVTREDMLDRADVHWSFLGLRRG